MAVAFMTRADANGWRSDMENAPRDGSVFLAINMRGKKAGRPFICLSGKLAEGYTHFAPDAGWYEPGRDWPSYPTHWQPLPAPPVSEGG